VANWLNDVGVGRLAVLLVGITGLAVLFTVARLRRTREPKGDTA